MSDDIKSICEKKFIRNDGHLLDLKTKDGKPVKFTVKLSFPHTDGHEEKTDVTAGRFYSRAIRNGFQEPIYYDKMVNWIILEKLCGIILYYRPFCIVEIGAGESTKVLAEAAEWADVPLYTVDIKAEKKVNYFPKHIFAHSTSDNFMEWFDDTPAIVLIDGDHSYDTAKKEFDFFFDKLIEGGVIFLHDTYPPAEMYIRNGACNDVYLLRQELEKREDLDCLTWPYTGKWMGLTMVMKKEKERPYWGE